MARSETTTPALFAVYLGGHAPRASIEVHDVVFVVANSLEEAYPQLLDCWFGSPDNLHIDAWVKVEQVDGYAITLTTESSIKQAESLYFVNLGAYHQDYAGEIHNSTLMVDVSARAVKTRAKLTLIRDAKEIHTDDLFEVDDCLHITEVGGYHLQLTPTDKVQPLRVKNGYIPLPQSVIDAWKAAR